MGTKLRGFFLVGAWFWLARAPTVAVLRWRTITKDLLLPRTHTHMHPMFEHMQLSLPPTLQGGAAAGEDLDYLKRASVAVYELVRSLADDVRLLDHFAVMDGRRGLPANTLTLMSGEGVLGRVDAEMLVQWMDPFGFDEEYVRQHASKYLYAFQGESSTRIRGVLLLVVRTPCGRGLSPYFLRLDLADVAPARAPQVVALPGGHRVGDTLYFVYPNHTYENGDTAQYGKPGTVTGLAISEFCEGLAMQFEGNREPVECFLSQLSATPPPALPGGHQVGDTLYFTSSSQTFEDGDKVEYGGRGTVIGPATYDPHYGKGCAIQFEGNRRHVECFLSQLSATPPPAMPGGFMVGQSLYFTGRSQWFDGGDEVMYGAQGTVVGPATSESMEGNGCSLKFGRNQRCINCFLSTLSATPPPALPGGHKVGDLLYFIGPGHTFASGDSIEWGKRGTVVGPGTSKVCAGLAIRFQGNDGGIECPLSKLSATPPRALPGGRKLGDLLYFTGSNHTFHDGDKLEYGKSGTVVGPALSKRYAGNGLAMKFEGNAHVVQCCLGSLSATPPPARLEAPDPAHKKRRKRIEKRLIIEASRADEEIERARAGGPRTSARGHRAPSQDRGPGGGRAPRGQARPVVPSPGRHDAGGGASSDPYASHEQEEGQRQVRLGDARGQGDAAPAHVHGVRQSAPRGAEAPRGRARAPDGGAREGRVAGGGHLPGVLSVVESG